MDKRKPAFFAPAGRLGAKNATHTLWPSFCTSSSTGWYHGLYARKESLILREEPSHWSNGHKKLMESSQQSRATSDTFFHAMAKFCLVQCHSILLKISRLLLRVKNIDVLVHLPTFSCCYADLFHQFRVTRALRTSNFCPILFFENWRFNFLHFRWNSLRAGHVSIRAQEKSSSHFLITKNTCHAHSRPFQAKHAQKMSGKKLP